MITKKPVRVRIAPSPTGDPHIGTAYMALFNFCFAKANEGQFIIRMEDTDQKRYRPKSEEMILVALGWLGLSWDEGPDVGGPHGPYKQSERFPIYKDYVEKLLDKGHAYRCFCTSERLEVMRLAQHAQKSQHFGYDGLCRSLSLEEAEKKCEQNIPFVIRMKMPKEGKTVFRDLLRGEIEIQNHEVDDQVLLKTDGSPTYHLAVVVDDHLMNISHVIRGEEWITSTPKHVTLYDMFGWEKPLFCHLPLLRNADKTKISKRKNPTSIFYYRRKGILPQVLLNFLALMGWSFGDNREIFSVKEMIDHFSLEKMTLGGPVFDLKKLSWLNSQYLKKESDEFWLNHIKQVIYSDAYLGKIIPLIKERMEKFEDFTDITNFFFQGDLVYKKELFEQKGKTLQDISTYLNEVALKLDPVEQWTHENLHGIFQNYLTEKALKPKDVLMPTRVATTGRKDSPPLFECLEVLGKDMVQRRLRLAADFLESTT